MVSTEARGRVTTAAELLKLPGDGQRYDLIRGELYCMSPAGARHGRVSAKVAQRLLNHVEPRKLGLVFGAETGFILARDPDVVLAPDVAFVRADRLPPDDQQDGFLALAPDLVVEIVSPSDRWNYVMDKVQEYLRAGVRLLWVIDPRRKSVVVFGPEGSGRTLGEGDSVDGGDVLLGLSLPVADVFAS